MNKMNEDLILNIFDYLYHARKNCILDNIKHIDDYINSTLVSKFFYNTLQKKCNIYFIYVPRCRALPLLCECKNHIDSSKNKIKLINKLNTIKNLHRNRNGAINELQLDTLDECKKLLPYLKEYADVAYINEISNKIQLYNKSDCCGSFFT